MGIRFEVWVVKPLVCPSPVRYCPSCGAARVFVCSERFRINAQKKLLDVWLFYRCSQCSGAWKFPVLERQAIATLAAATYEAYVRHERSMVWRHAFDTTRLRAYGAQLKVNVNYDVERRIIDGEHGADLSIQLVAPSELEIRLDRLLASELRVSRATIQGWYDTGQLRVWPEQSGALSKRIRGQRLLLSANAAERRSALH